MDWNVAPGTTFYSASAVRPRGQRARLRRGAAAANLFCSGNWPQMQNSYDINTFSIVNTLLHTFNPSTVLEVTVGMNYSQQSSTRWPE